jgi:predicted amidophosphoribosyltransferase
VSKILDLLLPTPCIICSVNGAPICIGCANQFETEQLTFEIAGVLGFSVTKYNDQSARIVNAVKESGITSLVPFMAREMISRWPTSFQSPLLVPLPSSPSNNRKRGFSQTLLLARELSQGMPGSKVQPLLKSKSARQDQVGLSAEQRKINLSGAFAPNLRGLREGDRPLVLVDDVCTTGASLAEASLTLRQAGLLVAGFAVFAKSGG